MLAYDSCHSPECIEDLKVNVVETIREGLKGVNYQFIRTNTVAEIDSMSTVGFASIGMPDIVFGLPFTEDSLEFWKEAVDKLQKYMIIYGVPEVGDVIDPIQFANFDADETKAPITCVSQLGVGDREIRIVRLATDRWFAGDGWQHALHYNEQERKDAVFLQWILPDEENRYPTDVGYNGPYQHQFETLPFGQRWVENKPTPERAARNRYMH
uniref:Uncharacterized protein n=1 Tax=Pseudomonas phage RVTF4 TaxID=3236931 RepID=A0AB39CCM0_9VIRU